jgi:tRNA A-37 threonylcarbamoyl transferase component Bud32
MQKMANDPSVSVAWHLPAELQGALVGPHGLRLEEWRRDGRLTIVKNGPLRAVYRVQLPELDIHIKHYRPSGLHSQLREFLRRNKAGREAALAVAIRIRGISTPEPIGWGREIGGIGNTGGWLITRTEPGVPLSTLFESGCQLAAESAHELARELGRFVARLHAAGVVHHDLHPGNILVDSVSAQPRFSLLDLHAVRIRQACTWPVRRANLVVFNRYFALRASRSARLRFWRSYSAEAKHIGLPVDRAPRELERLTRESNLRFWAARDRRCLANNRYYRRINTGTYRGMVVGDLDGSLAPLLEDPNRLIDQSVNLLKDGRSSTVIETMVSLRGEPVAAILKRFRSVDRRDPWLALLRRTPTVRSWVSGHGLRERCLPTARPLAVLHRYESGLPREGFLLTEKIEGATELRAWADSLIEKPAGERRRAVETRLMALARLLRQLHDRGIAHRDLKAANILTPVGANDGRFWFIDLVGISRRRHVADRRRAQNIARLHASFSQHCLITMTDKLRFLRAYLAWGVFGKSGWKSWWRRIARATQAKADRNARSGRPLA